MTTSTATDLGADLQDGVGRRQVLRDVIADRGLSGRAVRQCEKRLVDALVAALDTEVAEAVGAVWTGQRDLAEALRRTRGGGGPEDVVLADHPITSTHQLAVEVYLDAARIATITFDVDLSIIPQSVVAAVADGDITGFRTGGVAVRVAVSTAGQLVAQHERTCVPGALFAVAGAEAAPATDLPPAARRALRRGGVVVAGLVVLTAAAIARGVPVDPRPVDPGPAPGVAGTVRPGTEWNVRSGPSTRNPAVGSVRPGDPVRVRCLDGNWAELISPQAGSFVSKNGVDLVSTPPAC